MTTDRNVLTLEQIESYARLFTGNELDLVAERVDLFRGMHFNAPAENDDSFRVRVIDRVAGLKRERDARAGEATHASTINRPKSPLEIIGERCLDVVGWHRDDPIPTIQLIASFTWALGLSAGFSLQPETSEIETPETRGGE